MSPYYELTDPPGSPPTEQQLKYFRAYCDTYSLKQGAVRVGCSYSHFKNVLTALYCRLEVNSAIEALFALGWLVPPDVNTCGWIGRCGRPLDHTGNHGGFRAV